MGSRRSRSIAARTVAVLAMALTAAYGREAARSATADAEAAGATMIVLLAGSGSSPDPGREAMAEIVSRIQKADYEGDRKALLRLTDEITPHTKSRPLASRALYWRGFAWWRRALNGFNDSTDPKEIEKDLTEAVRSFTEVTAADPKLADAKVGAAACLFSLAFLNKEVAERRQEYLRQAIRLMGEVRKEAPENPRFLWVEGGGQWYVPLERGGGQAKAIETYERGLGLARRQRSAASDPLDPAWGEPELLMSLAWSHLNRATPDVNAAESSARAALALVPYWHYVRDILLPQIRAKAASPRGSRREPRPGVSHDLWYYCAQ